MKNTFGQAVTLTIFGESHGPAVGVVLDGLAPGLPVDEECIRRQLARRRPTTALDTPRQEPDRYQILSGVFQGRTTGTPVAIVIPNENVRSGDYAYGLARPSHADYAAYCKYHGYEDWRGGGHFSGRVTRCWRRQVPSCCPRWQAWASPWVLTSCAAATCGTGPSRRRLHRTWRLCGRRRFPP